MSETCNDGVSETELCLTGWREIPLGEASAAPDEVRDEYAFWWRATLRDVDGDGNNDLVFGIFDRLVFAFGDGKGKFELLTLPIEDTQTTQVMKVADFDGNDFLDVAFSSRTGIRALMNEQGRSFHDEVLVPAMRGVELDIVFETEDFDDDGDPDLAYVSDGDLMLLRNDGANTWNAIQRRTPEAGHETKTRLSADVDGDGVADLLVYKGSGIYYLLYGDQDAMLTSWSDLSEQFSSEFGGAVRAGDFDASGLADFVAMKGGGSRTATSEPRPGQVRVLLQQEPKKFSAAAPMEVSCGSSPHSLGVEDLDGDGNLDVVVGLGPSVPPDDTPPEAYRVTVLLGDGRGGFSDRTSVVMPFKPWQVAVGQIDDDGHPDVAALGPDRIGLLLSSP